MGLKIPNLPRGVADYMRGRPGSLIPSETTSGQLSFLPSGYGKTPTPKPMSAAELHRTVVRGAAADLKAKKPPFVSQGYGLGDPRAKVTGAARREELARRKVAKDNKADAKNAVKQQFKVDAAIDAGQMTNREIAFSRRNLMRRMKRS